MILLKKIFFLFLNLFNLNFFIKINKKTTFLSGFIVLNYKKFNNQKLILKILNFFQIVITFYLKTALDRFD